MKLGAEHKKGDSPFNTALAWAASLRFSAWQGQSPFLRGVGGELNGDCPLITAPAFIPVLRAFAGKGLSPFSCGRSGL
jgi:hypothetical protein